MKVNKLWWVTESGLSKINKLVSTCWKNTKWYLLNVMHYSNIAYSKKNCNLKKQFDIFTIEKIYACLYKLQMYYMYICNLLFNPFFLILPRAKSVHDVISCPKRLSVAIRSGPRQLRHLDLLNMSCAVFLA